MSQACIAFVVVVLLKKLGLSTLRSFGGFGVHLPCSAQVKTEMKGTLDEWSTQRARRVSVCAVLAMHEPNLGIHTLWHFLCASIHPPPLFTGRKGKCLLVLVSPWH